MPAIFEWQEPEKGEKMDCIAIFYMKYVTD